MEPSTKHFSAIELRCKCPVCKQQAPNQCTADALARLEQIRVAYGKPMTLTSAYRCAKHPSESRKARPGRHTEGVAFDIAVPWGADRMRLVKLAMDAGAKGFGFANSFIHIDFGDRPVLTCWDYK